MATMVTSPRSKCHILELWNGRIFRHRTNKVNMLYIYIEFDNIHINKWYCVWKWQIKYHKTSTINLHSILEPGTISPFLRQHRSEINISFWLWYHYSCYHWPDFAWIPFFNNFNVTLLTPEITPEVTSLRIVTMFTLMSSWKSVKAVKPR